MPCSRGKETVGSRREAIGRDGRIGKAHAHRRRERQRAPCPSRHEERVADECGIADHIGHAVRCVSRNVKGDRVEFADREALAVNEQMVELAAVTLEFGPGIEDLAEGVLDDADVLADAERAAEPLFDVGRGKEVVSGRGFRGPRSRAPL